MRISLLTDGLYPLSIGGMQKHSTLLCRYLLAEGLEVDIYHPHPAQDQESLFSSLNIPPNKKANFFTVPFPAITSLPGHYFLESFQHAKRIVSEYQERISQSDLVYAQGFTAWSYSRLRKKNPTLPPIIVNFHGLEMYQLAFGLKQKFIHQTYKPFIKENLLLADYAQSLGGQLSGILKKVGVPEGKILSLPIGIPESWLVEEVKSSEGKRRFVFVGRYERRKGTEELSQVIQNLSEEEEFTFDFIGNIPEDKRIKAPNITYWGMIKEEENIQRLLTKADVLVCPSYAEGMPTVILEGMARGCAIIATDVGAVSEVVDQQVGWLIEAGNPALLQETMVEAIKLNHPVLLQKKQQARKRISEKFTWEIVIKNMVKSFQEILHQSPKTLANIPK
ncbi:MAG: glycosyltransferase family 4 protein [Bacteroidota bacterium]